MDLKLENKVALVTGGNSGIGLATAKVFAAENARVVITGRRREEGERAAESIRQTGGDAIFIPCDVSDEQQVENAVCETLHRYGRLDIAFNNAGVEGELKDIAQLTSADWDKTVDINLKGVWLCIKHEVAAIQAAGGGAILNCSSWQAYGGLPGGSPYCASKAGLDGIVHSLALELGPQNIRINNLCPGNIDTAMVRRFFAPDDPRARPLIEQTPLGRFGSPEEIARTAVWLCSEAASFITGQSILADGGFSIPGPHRIKL